MPQQRHHVSQPQWFFKHEGGAQIQQVFAGVAARRIVEKAETHPRVDRLEGTECLWAVQPRHADVEQHNRDVVLLSAVELDGLGAALRLSDQEAGPPQADVEQRPQGGFVVDDQNLRPRRDQQGGFFGSAGFWLLLLGEGLGVRMQFAHRGASFRNNRSIRCLLKTTELAAPVCLVGE